MDSFLDSSAPVESDRNASGTSDESGASGESGISGESGDGELSKRSDIPQELKEEGKHVNCEHSRHHTKKQTNKWNHKINSNRVQN